MKALVAMSGGVDSSVAAALMLEAGHEVVGVTLKQWVGADGRLPTAGCCTVADADDASSVAARLGIRHYVLDHVADFESAVVDSFVDKYLAGLTPNPCVECNRRVRFGSLLERVDSLGCDFLVTGHYARVAQLDGRWQLLRGRDPAKDQSYVLHMLGQSELSRVRLPIGEMLKDEVRLHAERLGLRIAAKPDSQDLCFVGGDYREFLRDRAPAADRPGDIVDLDHGRVGAHDGIASFTVGQRKGLGVSLGEPRYVVGIDRDTAVVTLGSRHHLEKSGCWIDDVSFVSGPPSPEEPLQVKVRYRSDPVTATVTEGAHGRWWVGFDSPQAAVAPGQSAVLYRGESVVGGGEIVEVAA